MTRPIYYLGDRVEELSDCDHYDGDERTPTWAGTDVADPACLNLRQKTKPCTFWSIHNLTCGHTVCTEEPHACGANCEQPLNNPGFLCVSCLASGVESNFLKNFPVPNCDDGVLSEQSGWHDYCKRHLSVHMNMWHELDKRVATALKAGARHCSPVLKEYETKEWVGALHKHIPLRGNIQLPTLETFNLDQNLTSVNWWEKNREAQDEKRVLRNTTIAIERLCLSGTKEKDGE